MGIRIIRFKVYRRLIFLDSVIEPSLFLISRAQVVMGIRLIIRFKVYRRLILLDSVIEPSLFLISRAQVQMGISSIRFEFIAV